jgi:aldehyde:ferredoxin oxidoreductase
MSREELDRIGERIFVLHRALTIRDMGDKDMRTKHDLMPSWIYQDPNGAQPFSKGTIRMDPQDMARAMEMFYEVMGWDQATGAPTAEAYSRLGLQTVAEELEAKKLQPGGKG